MNDYILKFKRLHKREQNLLLGSAAFLLLVILYLTIWEPVFSSLENEITKNQSQKTILAWMQDAEKQVQAIRSTNNIVSADIASQSISSLVEKSAVSSGIRSAINKIKSDKKQAIKVQFNAVEFDRLAQWLGKLQYDYAITPKLITISHSDKPGLVSCQVTLEKSSS
ncbi:MAG: type II secretion system protein M [Gammaproteobacteria bacterium]|nr:type II secretion system protein M [Gammaproteobacteria bacterium]